MDSTDKKILDALQDNFPLTHRPFLGLAKRLGLDEDDLLARTRRMLKLGYIRRIAPILNTRELGRVATLVALKAPEDRIKEIASVINSYDGVSHNYLRRGKGKPTPYNIWFTMSAASNDELTNLLKEVEKKIGVPVHALPTTRIFKIGVRFKIDKEKEDG